MYDYIRLELTGYVPPPPASVAAYAGNKCSARLRGQVTPGATSYNLLRTTTPGSWLRLCHQRCHRPWSAAADRTTRRLALDTTAANGTTYYYASPAPSIPSGAAPIHRRAPGDDAIIRRIVMSAPATFAFHRPRRWPVRESSEHHARGGARRSGANFYSGVALRIGEHRRRLVQHAQHHHPQQHRRPARALHGHDAHGWEHLQLFCQCQRCWWYQWHQRWLVAVPLPVQPASHRRRRSTAICLCFSPRKRITLRTGTAVPGAVGYLSFRARPPVPRGRGTHMLQHRDRDDLNLRTHRV